MQSGDEVRWAWDDPADGVHVTLEVDPAQLLAVAALDPGGSVAQRRACWEQIVLLGTRDAPLARRLLDLSPGSVALLCHLAGEYLRQAIREPSAVGLTA